MIAELPREGGALLLARQVVEEQQMRHVRVRRAARELDEVVAPDDDLLVLGVQE